MKAKNNCRPDRVSPDVRSRIMAAIRSTSNRSTEWRLRAAIVASSIRGWQMHVRSLPGCPDFVFNKQRIVVFADGCFWHGCSKCYRRPFSSRDYWDLKVLRNKKRDRLANKRLRSTGWHVVRIWEHELNPSPSKCLAKIARIIAGSEGNSFDAHTSNGEAFKSQNRVTLKV